MLSLHRYVLALVITFGGCVPPVSPHPDSEKIREARALVDRGTVELRQGRLPQAEAAYRVALELTPLPAGFDGLGCVAFLQGDIPKAQSFWLRALELNPQYSQALGNLALLYETIGDFARSEALYKAALRAEPRNFRARNNYAAFLLRKNDRTLDDKPRAELLKAYTVARHPAIEANLIRNDKSDRSTYD